MRTSTKITAKGQITLPIALRHELGLKPGDRISFRRNPEGRFEVVAQTKALEDLKGILRYDGPPLSDDEIVDLVGKARQERASEIVARTKPRR